MHEMGIVIHVARTIQELAVENHLKKVGSVTLQYGEVTGVIPDMMVDCWNYFKKKEGYELITDAELKMEMIPAVTYCESCQKTYETMKYGKICPHCGSKETYLLEGNGYSIKEIEAEEDEAYQGEAE